MNRELEFHAGRLPAHADPDQEADRLPINYYDLARRYRWWLAAGLIAGLLLGHAIYLKLGPEYEAGAQILVARKSAIPVKDEQRALTSWGERTEHIALIMSPMIASRAMELGQLDRLPTFLPGEDHVEDLIKRLKVKRSAGQDRSIINVLNVSYSSKKEKDAQKVVDAVIAAYAEYLERSRREQSAEVLALTQKAHDEILAKLRQKEQEYLDFRDAAPLQWRSPVGATPDGQATTTNVHQERVLKIEEQRQLSLLRQAELRSRTQAIKQAVQAGESRDALEVLIRRFMTADGPSAADVQRQQEITAFENKLLPLLLEEQRLTRDYGKDHPEVQSVRKSIETTIQFYREHGLHLPGDLDEKGEPVRRPTPDFIVLYQESLKQQLAELAIRDRELEELFEEELINAKKLAKFQAQDQSMNSEIGQYRAQWENLIGQVNQVGIEKDSSGYTMKQLAPVKSMVSMKRRLKFYSAGSLFCLGIVSVWVFVREWRDTTLKTAKDLQQCVRRPVLGGIRDFHMTPDQWGPLSGHPHPALRYLHAPTSTEAEHIRSIRSALSVTVEDRKAKVIQFSSPEPGDGKTTLLANLAVAEAQSGKRVLLLDADLRRPCVHALFRVAQGRGLSEALNGLVSAREAARPSGVEGLTLLTAGTPPSNPAEVLSSPRWQRLLNELRPDYDLIFVDSPPFLAVSDPCEIARFVDGLLLVVRLGKNRRPAVIRTRDLIAGHNLPLLGVLANSLSPEDSTGYGTYKEYLSPAQENRTGTRTPEYAGV